jgi:hypothetical protein
VELLVVFVVLAVLAVLAMVVEIGWALVGGPMHLRLGAVLAVLLLLLLEAPMLLSLLVVEVLPLERQYCWSNYCSRANLV